MNVAARYISDGEPLATRLNDAAYELDDIADELYALMESAEFDPNELDRIEARLDAIYRLSLKYGENEEQMLAFLEDARRQLEMIEQSDLLINKLTAQLADCREQTVLAAEKLTAARKSAAERMAEAICRELSFLDMPMVKFVVDMQPTDLSADGADSVKFLISTNVGEPPKPLSKIASGGELSRIMLAIKSVIADKDTVGTLIFDEVDTGVSGSAAQKVGVKLLDTSRGKQVICVTHLAQIAALADCHLKISKQSAAGRTFTEVELLQRDGRINEVARIMSTGVITDNMLKLAAELIDGRLQ
jgi:DNA repair protein RecN (Recombination protein N)